MAEMLAMEANYGSNSMDSRLARPIELLLPLNVSSRVDLSRMTAWKGQWVLITWVDIYFGHGFPFLPTASHPAQLLGAYRMPDLQAWIPIEHSIQLRDIPQAREVQKWARNYGVY